MGCYPCPPTRPILRLHSIHKSKPDSQPEPAVRKGGGGGDAGQSPAPPHLPHTARHRGCQAPPHPRLGATSVQQDRWRDQRERRRFCLSAALSACQPELLVSCLLCKGAGQQATGCLWVLPHAHRGPAWAGGDQRADTWQPHRPTTSREPRTLAGLLCGWQRPAWAGSWSPGTANQTQAPL